VSVALRFHTAHRLALNNSRIGDRVGVAITACNLGRFALRDAGGGPKRPVHFLAPVDLKVWEEFGRVSLVSRAC